MTTNDDINDDIVEGMRAEPSVPSLVWQGMREGEEIKLLDHGYVRFIESWGSDQRIIESARMSTDKGFLGWGPKGEETCKRCAGRGYVPVAGAEQLEHEVLKTMTCSLCLGKG